MVSQRPAKASAAFRDVWVQIPEAPPLKKKETQMPRLINADKLKDIISDT